MKQKKTVNSSKSLNQKLRYIIVSMLIPMVVCIVVILALLGVYAVEYSQITHNVNVGSKFSLNFKENMDLKMYHYTVGSSEQKELPIEDVEDAIAIAKSLASTTERKESKQVIKNVLEYCENLEKRMYTLEATTDYDSRQLQLENNIYVLTKLIQGKMMDYIYYEAGYMAEVEKRMTRDLVILMTALTICTGGVVTLLLYRSFRFSDGITKPISALCENVRQVGHGDFTIPAVESDDYEIAHLNAGIQKMAGRIKRLLTDVKEEENLQHKTQLQLLQAQVNPHFLYNTLDNIVWLVESGKSDGAIKMLSDLSVFFRTALSKGNDVIRLEEEIMHTKSYLDIQHVRYLDIMDYSIVLPSQLQKVMIPKLTLQPLAENALYHGVKEKRGKSRITIICKEAGENVLITVTDDGIGIQPKRLKEIQESLDSGQRVGFGVAAVQERIKLYFGNEYGMQIESEYGKGTKVEILIPKENELIS